MPKSKNRKDHKKKVSARNQKIKDAKKKLEKDKRDFIMNLIKQEQEKGMFDNIPTIDPISINEIEGPSI